VCGGVKPKHRSRFPINEGNRDPDLGFNGENVGGTTDSNACRPASTPMLEQREHRIKLLRQTDRPGVNLRTVRPVYAHEGVDNALGMWDVSRKARNNREKVTARLLSSLILYLRSRVRVPGCGVASP
jgi:hypothetical protein